MTCIDYHSHFPYFQKEFRIANLNNFEVKPISENKKNNGSQISPAHILRPRVNFISRDGTA
jgi:hypothetical protein